MTMQDRLFQAQAEAEDADELERYDLIETDGQTEDEPAESFFLKLING